MAYTTTNKIKGMFRSIDFGDGSNPSDTESEAISLSDVRGFIKEADSIIDSALFDQYEIPITGENALLAVGMISKFMVTAIVDDILTRGQERDENATDYSKKAEKLLADLVPENKNGKVIPARKTLIDSVKKRTRPETKAVSKSGPKQELKFSRTRDNW